MGSQIGTIVLTRSVDGISWTSSTVTKSSSAVLCLASGDVDGDGAEDLVFAASAGVSWISDVMSSAATHEANASAPYVLAVLACGRVFDARVHVSRAVFGCQVQ